MVLALEQAARRYIHLTSDEDGGLYHQTVQCCILELNLSTVEVIVASTDDYDALVNMAAKARVVINCVGPVSLEFDYLVVLFCSSRSLPHWCFLYVDLICNKVIVKIVRLQ